MHSESSGFLSRSSSWRSESLPPPAPLIPESHVVDDQTNPDKIKNGKSKWKLYFNRSRFKLWDRKNDRKQENLSKVAADHSDMDETEELQEFRDKELPRFTQSEMDHSDMEETEGLQKFSYKELHSFTQGFKTGIGGSLGSIGHMYRGLLTGDMSSAKGVPRLVMIRVFTRPTQLTESWWATEIKVMSQLSHPNLVQLLGWCREDDHLALVYEFIPSGSLYNHLQSSNKRSALPWETRYWRIAIGLASALLYLQEGSKICMVHMDIEPVNIMLDPDFNPKLKNFGISRIAMNCDSEQEIAARSRLGTPGYQAPEFLTKSTPCKEFDIYSFGVIALEIASGRQPFASAIRTQDMDGLQQWVTNLHRNGAILEAADPCLGNAFDEKEMERLLLVGLWCTQKNPRSRPSIQQVLDLLNLKAPVPKFVADHSNLQTIKFPLPTPSPKDKSEKPIAVSESAETNFDIGLPLDYCSSSQAEKPRKGHHSSIVNGFVDSLHKMLQSEEEKLPQFDEVLETIKVYTASLVKIVDPPLDDWNELTQVVLRALKEDRSGSSHADSDGHADNEDISSCKAEMHQCKVAIEQDEVKLEEAKERLAQERKRHDLLLAELTKAEGVCHSIEEEVKVIEERKAHNVVKLDHTRRRYSILNLFQSVLNKHDSLALKRSSNATVSTIV